MAGVYVHVPFCRRACHYCDFHFTTNLKNAQSLVNTIIQEIEIRKAYTQNEPIRTIYFGGGTPSLLSSSEIERVLNTIYRTQSVQTDAEITLEANPEDLSNQKLLELKNLGVNRLSLGTQSFIDAELKWMNRMHTSKQAIECVGNAQDAGFGNISIDLIFGLPGQTEHNWSANLKQATSLNIQHISSYSLTVEPKTVLHNRIQKGIQAPPEENSSIQFFEMNMEVLNENGFEHYEISNYAKPGFVSKHNSSYWLGTNYLGVGPSAHSFNGKERQWNIRSNAAYIKNISSNRPYFETETLSEKDRVNEQILTRLRTKWGVEKQIIDQISANVWGDILKSAEAFDPSELEIRESLILLTDSGKLRADFITASLFIH